MIFNMYLKECKIISRSIIYYAFIIILVLFYKSQYSNDTSSSIKQAATGNRVVSESDNYRWVNPLVEPKETDITYGKKSAEIPEQVIPRVTNILYSEYLENSFSYYPYGFIKHKKLKESELSKVDDIFKEITGKTIIEVNNEIHELYLEGNNSYELPIREELTYERFKELMTEMEEMIGPGCVYSDLSRFGTEEVTFEEAKEEYRELVEDDRFSNAFARLFSDYIGIMLAIFPVFVVTAHTLRDRKSKMQELIFSRKASSAAIIGARYLALTTMMFVPVLILAIVSTVGIMNVAHSLGLSIDYFAFIKYSFVWLLPTLMVTASVGYLIAELTQSAVGIVVQGALWFINLSMTPLVGGYGFSLILRHNTLGKYSIYHSRISEIIVNRGFYLLVSFGLVAITVIVYNLKRRGKWYAKRKNRKIS